MTHYPTHPARQVIGPPAHWWMIRFAQLFVVIGGIVIGVTKPPRQTHEIALIPIVAVVVLLVFDLFARGTATAQGITFVRYRDEHYVPWRDVEEVLWSPKAIRIKLRDRHFLRRYVMFPLQTNVKRNFSFAFGGEVEPPPFIEWLNANGYMPPEKVRRQNRWTW